MFFFRVDNFTQTKDKVDAILATVGNLPTIQAEGNDLLLSEKMESARKVLKVFPLQAMGFSKSIPQQHNKPFYIVPLLSLGLLKKMEPKIPNRPVGLSQDRGLSE